MDHSLNSQNQMAQAKNWKTVHPKRLATFLKVELKLGKLYTMQSLFRGQHQLLFLLIHDVEECCLTDISGGTECILYRKLWTAMTQRTILKS